MLLDEKDTKFREFCEQCLNKAYGEFDFGENYHIKHFNDFDRVYFVLGGAAVSVHKQFIRDYRSNVIQRALQNLHMNNKIIRFYTKDPYPVEF
jgi:hypothetical protein